MEDNSGGISGMIIRGVAPVAPAIELVGSSSLSGTYSSVSGATVDAAGKKIADALIENYKALERHNDVLALCETIIQKGEADSGTYFTRAEPASECGARSAECGAADR